MRVAATLALGAVLNLGLLFPPGVLVAHAQAQTAQPLRPQAAQLVAVRGRAVDLAIGINGSVYALDEDGTPWLQSVEGKTASWTRMPGRFRAMRATLDGSVWGLGLDDALYRLSGSAWRVFATGIRDVSAMPDSTVLAISVDGELQTLFPSPARHPLAPEFANPQRVVADEHGMPWLLHADGRLVRYSGVRWEPVVTPPGGLASLAIDGSGTVMAVTRAGALVQRNGSTGQWEEPYPGLRALSVALGPRGKPWVVREDRQLVASEVFALSGPAAPAPSVAAFTRLLSWKQVPGNARSLSIGEDGSVLRIDQDGNLSRWNGRDNWMVLPGRFVQVAAVAGGGAWAIDPRGQIMRLQGGVWRDQGAVALDIAAGPRDRVWIVQPDGRIAARDPATGQWQVPPDSGSQARAVAVGPDGEPWIIAAEDGTVRGFQGGAWIDYPGITAASLGIGADGTAYATSVDGQLVWLDKRERQWKPANGYARRVAVGPKGAPWIIGERNEVLISSLALGEAPSQADARGAAASPFIPPAVLSFSIPPATQTRRPLAYTPLQGSYLDIGIGGNGTVFAAGTDGGLYCFSNADKRFLYASSGQARRVAVTLQGFLWVVSASGDVSYHDAAGWRNIPGHKSQDIAVGPDASVLSVGTSGQVFRYVAASNAFEPFALTTGTPVVAKRVAGSASSVVWVITSTDQLQRCERGNCQVQSITARDLAMAPDGTLFVVDGAGNVQRYNQVRRLFEQQNGNGASIAVGPQGIPWLVNSSGQASSAGLFGVSSKTINTPACATQFQQAQAPVVAPVTARSIINAVADSETVPAGGSFNLLANDSLNGTAPNASQVSINFVSRSIALTQSGGLVSVSPGAAGGSTHSANYTICALPSGNPCSTASVTITVGRASVPAAPTALVATVGNRQASVAFTAPTNNGGSTIIGYRVTSSPGGFTATGTASPIVVTGLNNGTAYTFTVTATNSVGTGAASASSNSVTPGTALTVPGAPTGASATVGNAQATVSFTAPASNGGSAVTSYRVTATPGNATATGSGSPITVTGLTNNTSYTFTVAATNSAGTGAASAATNSVTPGTVPGAPTNVVGTPLQAGEIEVSFNAPASSGTSAVTLYSVTRNPGGQVTTGTSSPITVTGLASGTYTFTVTATNSTGTGAASSASAAVVIP